MTTAKSPTHVLRTQAVRMAQILKAAERGDKLKGPHAEKIVAARAKESVTFAVAMDDKILRITMAWSDIRDTTEAGIADFILKHMQEEGGKPE